MVRLHRVQRTASSQGFTLIELLVVLSIISLLASIVLVTVDTARLRARVSAVKQNVRTIATEAELYRSSQNTYISSEALSACGSTGGFLGSERSIDALTQIGQLSKRSITDHTFYCSVLPDKWSLAVDISELMSRTVLCASSAGRILLLGNSNDSSASDFVDSGECVQP